MVHIYTESSFKDNFLQIRDDLVKQDSIDVGEWQSIHKPMVMRELLGVVTEYWIPVSPTQLAHETGARLPWAEDHFQERVGGQPLNPAPSEAWWPFAQKKNDSTNGEHKSEGEAFSHTYPERMWPKQANPDFMLEKDALGEEANRWGIRFEYGDLQDVVEQLIKSPMTRQAYLPIWFPEDTGAVHGKRVPCTLGYHFIIRDGYLNVSYFMRSTDLLRHYQDDIYMAARLAQWVADKMPDDMAGNHILPGMLTFHTANMHIFDADLPMIEYWKSQGQAWKE